jgi:hypothetical protein
MTEITIDTIDEVVIKQWVGPDYEYFLSLVADYGIQMYAKGLERGHKDAKLKWTSRDSQS